MSIELTNQRFWQDEKPSKEGGVVSVIVYSAFFSFFYMIPAPSSFLKPLKIVVLYAISTQILDVIFLMFYLKPLAVYDKGIAVDPFLSRKERLLNLFTLYIGGYNLIRHGKRKYKTLKWNEIQKVIFHIFPPHPALALWLLLFKQRLSIINGNDVFPSVPLVKKEKFREILQKNLPKSKIEEATF